MPLDENPYLIPGRWIARGDPMPNDGEPDYVEPILGIVFDLDGTLVVSRHDFDRMRREVIATAVRHGADPGALSPKEPVARLFEAVRSDLTSRGRPEGDLYRFEAEANRAIDAIEMEALPRTTVRDGAAPLLAHLSERGYRLGLLTRSAEPFVRAALARTSLAEYFPYLRTRSAPGPAKPSPEALFLLLSEMGVPPDRALFVGDHLIDAECATRARVHFYALLPVPGDDNGMTRERFLAAGAAAVAEDLPDLGRMLGLPARGPSARPA